MHTATRTVLGLSLSLLLFSCGQPAASGPSAEAPTAADAWEYTAPADKVTTLSLTPGENNLYFEPILAAKNGYGPIEIDRSNGGKAAGDGKTLTLNGVKYARGFGTNANSELRYSLKGTDGAQCNRFTADVGVDDEVGNKGSVVFQVFLDGVKAYDSGTLTGTSATKKIDLDISGKNELRLIVTDAKDSGAYDHADWASPKIFCAARTVGQPGALDPSFGGGAVVTSFESDPNLSSLGRRAVVQQGGKIVVDGSIYNPGGSGNGKTALARYNSDGTLDASFGSGGKAVIDFGQLEQSYALRPLPDGKLLLGGTLTDASGAGNPFLARLNANGTLDTSFGNAGKTIIVTSADDYLVPVTAIFLQPDGQILTRAGNSMRRFSPGGVLDAAYGSGGRIYLSGGIAGSAALPDGKLLLIGSDGALRRYDASGLPDRSFGDGGQVSHAFLAQGGAQLVGYSVVVTPDGQLVVGLETLRSTGTGNPPQLQATDYLVRRNADGSLDASFGSGGALKISGQNFPRQVQSDGKLLAYPQRYNPDGSVDTTFKPALGAGVTVNGTAIAPDDKIVVVGAKQKANFNDTDVFVARLLP